MSSAPLKTIPETFAGADVFITGGSGFMGKVLIEKLLRSCPGINQVFVLIRPKKGKTPEERIDELVQIPLFDVLRKTRPEDLRKIIPISGDCSVLKLDLDETSLKRLENVQFVFHAAASVRFDDPLAKAILLNTRGTREVCRWAETLKNLKAIVHISTTFCNPEIFDVEERIYPAKMDWRKAIEIAENVDPETLEILSQKLTGFAPNTYTYTKALAEQICSDYHKTLPIVVYRPSVVSSAEKEPLVGWIDNLNGPFGLLLGCATGIVRTTNLDLNLSMNWMPVDVSIKGAIITAWKQSLVPSSELMVYNNAVEQHKTITHRFLMEAGSSICLRVPMSKTLWFPGVNATKCKYWFYTLFFWLQIVPSVLVDLLLKLTGKQPILMKLQRKIFYAQISMAYFGKNDWVFKNNNYRSLGQDLEKADKDNFDINCMCDGLYQYVYRSTLGGRQYIMNEPDDTLPYATTRARRLQVANTILKYLFYFSLLYLIYKRFLIVG
ncbi:fatty acyl-CoA reductase wat-like isoform X1 [Toxorhynchites rutilus septentrionalis]|uniref:fatty acyl-CoA reductase wat-like isoform X1 n=1 Tax=Toxorhynchites rutilus septentrionalis TaxID=329112 RepID=UPI0024791336|nr:fatty acyl-CoA reductase wat-like isoform X1 [Toxorhynchites rutilus septentrionalis]